MRSRPRRFSFAPSPASSALAPFVLVTAAACGGARPDPARAPAAAPTDATAEPEASAAKPAEPPAASAPAAPPPTPEAIFARLSSDFQQCYVAGKKATPTMGNGKITLHAAVDGQGVTRCVVPSEDTGLTQEVEDCMSDRLAKETYAGTSAFSVEVPLGVKGGKVGLRNDANDGPVLESVESHGLGDPHAIIDALVPKLKVCLGDLPASDTLRVLYVGGRVGKDGHVTCALATSATDELLPPKVGACVADVLDQAKFPPPKSGSGLVSIPLKVPRATARVQAR